jgi:hypothetical protein
MTRKREPLNKHFDGAHAHHVNDEQVIYIPEEMHRRPHNLQTGKGMVEMNTSAFRYLLTH